MQNKTALYSALGIVIALLIVLVAYKAGLFGAVRASSTATSTPATASTTNLGGGVSGQATGKVIVKEGSGASVQPPALKPIAYAAATSADLKTAVQKQYDKLAPQLKAAPTRTDLWLEAGILYKIGGDYGDAATVWTYVAATGSGSNKYVAYGNLGDLYLNFTHEYGKAVTAYTKAVALAPDVADYQAGLKDAKARAGQ